MSPLYLIIIQVCKLDGLVFLLYMVFVRRCCPSSWKCSSLLEIVLVQPSKIIDIWIIFIAVLCQRPLFFVVVRRLIIDIRFYSKRYGG